MRFLIDWNVRLDNYTAAVLARLDDTDHPISSADAFKLCYFGIGIARFLVVVQPPREKWFALFNPLLDRIDPLPDELRPSLDEDKASVADHMLTMLYWAEGGSSRPWTKTSDSDEEFYAEWSKGWRETDSIVPDRLIESIAPHASPQARLTVSWRVRRALEILQAKPANIHSRAIEHQQLEGISGIEACTIIPHSQEPEHADISAESPRTGS